MACSTLRILFAKNKTPFDESVLYQPVTRGLCVGVNWINVTLDRVLWPDALNMAEDFFII
jgi:hypothetical protein